MKIYSDIATLLKAGHSKIEVFEKLFIDSKDPKELAKAISQFPSPSSYRENQILIRDYYRYLLVYALVLFSLGLSTFLTINNLKVTIAYLVGMIFMIGLPHRTAKGVKFLMGIQLLMPLIFSTYYPFELIRFLIQHPDIKRLESDREFLIFTSVFVLYSAVMTIYAFRVMRVVFKRELFWTKWKWNKETNKPTFLVDE